MSPHFEQEPLHNPAPQPGEPEEAELSLEQIGRILGWLPSERTDAFYALARILCEREAKPDSKETQAEETPEQVDAALRSYGYDPDAIGKRCAETAERAYAAAVSPSPPETAAELEKPRKRDYAAELQASTEAIKSVTGRILQVAENLDVLAGEAHRYAEITNGLANGTWRRFVCKHCGKPSNYDCEFCHGDGEYWAEVQPPPTEPQARELP